MVRQADPRGLTFRWGLAHRARLTALLSVGEAAARAGLSVRELQHAIQAGALPVQQVEGRVGWDYRIAPDDLASFVGATGAGPPGSRLAAGSSLPPSVWASLAAARRLDWRLVALVLGAMLIALAGIAYALNVSTPGGAATRRGVHGTPRGSGPICGAGHARCAPSTPLPTARPTAAGSTHGSATTVTSFTLILRARATGRTVTMRGSMTLGGALTPSMRSLYLGCPPARATPGPTATPVQATPSSTIFISSTIPLSLTLVHKLETWIAAYVTLLNNDNPRVSGFVIDDQHEDFEAEGMAIWRKLHLTVDSGFTVAYFSEQQNAEMLPPSGPPCASATPTSRAQPGR